MQYELQIAGDRYLFVSQQGNDTAFLCVFVCIFPAKATPPPIFRKTLNI